MKLKFLVPVVTGILTAVFLYISSTTQNSTVDKWTSFGMGITTAIFVSSLIAAIKDKKTKAL